MSREESTEEEREDQEFEAPLPEQVQLAYHARHCAVIGLLIWPLQIYTIWLVLKLWLSSDALGEKDRQKARKATLIATLIVPIVLIVVVAILSIVGFPPRGPAQLDPMTLDRPLVMCGVWEGKRQDPAGETLIPWN